MYLMFKICVIVCCVVFFVFVVQFVVIGLDVDMSFVVIEGGQVIKCGVLLVVDEINVNGGILGCKVVLEISDYCGNLVWGVKNIE